MAPISLISADAGRRGPERDKKGASGTIGVDWCRAVARYCAGNGKIRCRDLHPAKPKAHNTRLRVFLCGPVVPAISVMAGWAGQPSGWPVSLGPGSANPVQLVTRPRFAPLLVTFTLLTQRNAS
ncbi:ash family protein [Aeromonas dhakensis]|nr:ash family protein [Aeromonas dhakensis]